MEDQPAPLSKPMRSTPVWQPQLNRIEARLDALGAAVEKLDARVTELAANAVRGERSDADDTADDVLHHLDLVSNRIADQALDGAVNREVLQRIEGTVASFSDTVSRLAGSLESVRSMVESLHTTSVANEVATSGLSGAVDELGDRLSMTQKRMISRSHLDEVRHRVEQAEVALARQANLIGDALRSRIDDQRVLSNELGAQISNLNASLSRSSDVPDKVRRELNKAVESLAERMGIAMREVRKELTAASTGNAPTPAVNAGLDRISGRLQADANRIAQVVANVQADNEDRMRRLNLQVSELHRSLELLRWGQRIDGDLASAEKTPTLSEDRLAAPSSERGPNPDPDPQPAPERVESEMVDSETHEPETPIGETVEPDEPEAEPEVAPPSPTRTAGALPDGSAVEEEGPDAPQDWPEAPNEPRSFMTEPVEQLRWPGLD